MFLPGPLTVLLVTAFRQIRERLAENREAGYSTETVLVTALLVALAIGAVAVITAKVMGKANSIDLG